jgi:hypothetical protein
LTAPQTSKRNSTSTRTRESASTDAVILRNKTGRDSNSALSLCTMYLMYLQEKKSMGIKSGFREGQLIIPPLPVHHQKIVNPEQFLYWHKNDWCIILLEMRPSNSPTSKLPNKMVHQSIFMPFYALLRFPGRWIGRGGTINWPPRNADLTPMDFSFWGYIRDIVHSEISESLPNFLSLQ